MISVSFFKLQTFTFLLEVELSQRWETDCSYFAFVMSGLCLASLAPRKIIVSFTQFSFIARFCCKTLLETVPDKHGLHVAAGRTAVAVEETWGGGARVGQFSGGGYAFRWLLSWCVSFKIHPPTPSSVLSTLKQEYYH